MRQRNTSWKFVLFWFFGDILVVFIFFHSLFVVFWNIGFWKPRKDYEKTTKSPIFCKAERVQTSATNGNLNIFQ